MVAMSRCLVLLTLINLQRETDRRRVRPLFVHATQYLPWSGPTKCPRLTYALGFLFRKATRYMRANTHHTSV